MGKSIAYFYDRGQVPNHQINIFFERVGIEKLGIRGKRAIIVGPN